MRRDVGSVVRNAVAGQSDAGRSVSHTDTINAAREDFVAMAPSMLKKKVVELVFLPWLSAFAARVVKAAKHEERQAILALLAEPTGAPEGGPLWKKGHNSALESARAAILRRCDDGP